MDSLSQDLRHSLRTLARQPGLVLVAVLSLALGMGVNTAIFSALNSLLLRPLAVRHPDRAVYVYHADPSTSDRGTSFPAYERYRDRTDLFASAMAFTGARPLRLADGASRAEVYAEPVTAGFFSIANVDLAVGRPFDREVDQTTAPRFVAVLSHRFWQRQFASDRGVVGRDVVLNGRAFTVTGVAAPGFIGLDPEVSVDLWIPLTTWAHVVGEPSRLTGDEHWITTVAELASGVRLDQAQAAVAVEGRSLGPPSGQETRVRSVRERSGGSATDALAIGGAAFAVGLLVLGVACVNVTSLLIARAAARQREMSVRLALGAGRARLVRLWVVDSAVLSALAALAGLFVASAMLDLVVAFRPPAFIGQSGTPTLPLEFHLDYRVFAFTLGLAALTALGVGLVTGLHSSNPKSMPDLRSDRVTDRRFAPGFNVRSAVIALQVALSLMLLIPCGLFVRSWIEASAAEPGFSSANVLLLPISTDQAGVRVQKPPGFERDLLDRVRRLPGVERATAMDPVPLWFGGRFAWFSVGRDDGSDEAARAGFAAIAPGYFETLRIPLVRGRDFTSADSASAPRVAIANETLARRFWPDVSPIGRRIRTGEAVIDIVGLAADAKYGSLAEAPQPFFYLPLAQEPSDNPSLSLAVRATGDPMRLAGGIEREVRAIVPTWPAFAFRTLDEGLDVQRLLPRVGATLLGALGAFGLLLAMMGIYGVMSYVVRQRTHEIGIRLALGAPRRHLVALVMRDGMTVCLAGAAIGIGVALAATRLLSSLLVGIGAADPLTYIVVPSSLVAVAMLASYLPARRVARVNPLDALRRD